MRKKILILLITAGFCSLMPQTSFARVEFGDRQTELAEPQIRMAGNVLTVSGARGMKLEIYTLTGSKKATYEIEGDQVSINTDLQKGWYILKLGSTVRKIAIK